MPFAEYLTFANGIGWLVGLIMAAVVPTLLGGFGRRHVGWLIAFCVTRILSEIVTLTVTGAASGSANKRGGRHRQRHASAVSQARDRSYRQRPDLREKT